MTRKIILSCAITGSVHTPTMSPYIPITPKEIADDAIRAAEAGAATVHIHARNPKTGEPSTSIELFHEIITRIKEKSDVIVCVTGGGTYKQSDAERIQVVTKYKPELASLDIGSLNYGVFPLAKKYKDWKFDWEEPYLSSSEDSIFPGTFKSLKFFAQEMDMADTLPEIEIFDTAWLNNTKYLYEEGYLKKPLWLQFVLGILGGAPVSVEVLTHLVTQAKAMFGDDFKWSLACASRYQYSFLAAALAMGGHIRVGLEDALYISKGVLAKSNAEFCEKAERIVHELGYELATPDEAREMLGTKGIEKVEY